MADELLRILRQGLNEAKKQRKSDEIINYISKYWYLFCSRKAYFESIKEELMQRNDLSVTALLEALGADPRIVFKHVKAVTASELLLNPEKSTLMNTFRNVVDERRRRTDAEDPEICLFCIAGDHSVVITNHDVKNVPGHACVVIDSDNEEPRTYAFWAADAAKRIPGLFNKR